MRPIKAALLAICMLMVGSAPGHAANRKPMPADAKAYIIWPSDGQVVSAGGFWVRMGLSNAGVAPAGVDVPNTGHHHLLIDTDLPPLDEPIARR